MCAAKTRSTDYDRAMAQAIKHCRMMAGLTQSQLAEAMGVTYQQAHKYESELNRVSFGRVVDAAHALGVTVVQLVEQAMSIHGGEHGLHGRQVLLDMQRFSEMPSARRRALLDLEQSYREMTNAR